MLYPFRPKTAPGAEPKRLNYIPRTGAGRVGPLKGSGLCEEKRIGKNVCLMSGRFEES